MKIDDPTYESLLRQKWFVPGAHERRDLADDTPYADDYEASLASPTGRKTPPGFAIALLLVGGIAAGVMFVSWLAMQSGQQ